MNISRRTLLLAAGAGALATLTGCGPSSGGKVPSSAATGGVMPEEGARHTSTWMSLHVDDEVWGEELAPAVRETLQELARTIARYEPVSALVAKGGSADLDLEGVTLIEQDADDLWMRDTGPTFVHTDDGLAGVDFNFNGWGDKQKHERDARVAEEVCKDAKTPRIRTELVLEGGALEVDGEGTAIITESCVLNENRNPGWSKKDVEKELERLLGIRHVIWLPGIAGKDITDGHTDFYARFARPGVVVAGRDDDPDSYDYAVTRRHLEILGAAVDAKGRPLEVHVLPGPSTVRPEFANDEFAAGYVNFYVCNGAVIAPQFGDEAGDSHAKETLTALFPDREILQLDIDPIAAGGGGIHCATQQQPAAAR